MEPQDLWKDRNSAIIMMNAHESKIDGLIAWKKKVGYGKRARVEGLFSRLKRIFGFHFMSKNEMARKNELVTKLSILNYFNLFTKPVFKRIT